MPGGSLVATANPPVEQGLRRVMWPPDDLAPLWGDRNSAAMIHYLDWEVNLGRKYAAEWNFTPHR